MRTSFFLLPASIAVVAAVAAPQASGPSSIILSATASSAATGTQATATVSPGSIGLGETCDPTTTSPCSYGAQCYASNSMLNPVCGNFQASCTSDAQCAFNTCSNGFCNGAPVTGSVALGSPCSPKIPGQCANGASCYAVNSMLIPNCGNFQASCTSDSQCAFNTCNQGLCNGVLSSSASGSPATSFSPTGSFTSVLSTATGSSGPATTGYSNSTATGAFSGASTSVVVIGGKTTSVLVNSAGATTAIGSAASPTSTGTGSGSQSAGTKGSVQSVVAFFSVAVSVVFAVAL